MRWIKIGTWEQSLLWQCIDPSLCQINSSPIRCFSQLSLFHSRNQSFIPPKSQLQQMKWKTEWKKIGGILLGWSCYYMFVKFPFGTEIRQSQQNHEGWLGGVWDGNSWDPSQRFRSWSQQNPNRRCSTKLPMYHCHNWRIGKARLS